MFCWGFFLKFKRVVILLVNLAFWVPELFNDFNFKFLTSSLSLIFVTRASAKKRGQHISCGVNMMLFYRSIRVSCLTCGYFTFFLMGLRVWTWSSESGLRKRYWYFFTVLLPLIEGSLLLFYFQLAIFQSWDWIGIGTRSNSVGLPVCRGI